MKLLDDVAAFFRAARAPTGRVTGVRRIPVAAGQPSLSEEIAREMRPHARHPDPGAAGAFAPRPAARDANPRMVVPDRASFHIPAGRVGRYRWRFKGGGGFTDWVGREGPCDVREPPAVVESEYALLPAVAEPAKAEARQAQL